MDKDLRLLCCRSSDSLAEAIEVIDKNGKELCFILEGNKLIGVLADSDIRRLVLGSHDRNEPVTRYMNKSPLVVRIGVNVPAIIPPDTSRARVIPVVDSDDSLVDFIDKENRPVVPVYEPDLSGNEMLYVSECIKSGWVSSQGLFVDKFERAFSMLHENRLALSVSNCTAGLHLGLVSLGIGSGDEVLVPDLTFAATINAVLHAGAKPVLVDIDQESWCIDPEAIRRSLTSKTKAVIAVHLYGQPARVDEIARLCKEEGLYLIEDCAESLGSQIDNRRTGCFGDISVFSFFGNKTITSGEGGMMLFRDPKVFQLATIIRDHGMSKSKRYWHEQIGFNYRLTNLQAAVGLAQIERINEIIAKKVMLAETYRLALDGINGIQFPPVRTNCLDSSWLFTILITSNSISLQGIVEAMSAQGVETRRVFYPLSSMPLYRAFRKVGEEYEVSNHIHNCGLSLPSFPSISRKDSFHVVEAVKSALAKGS